MYFSKRFPVTLRLLLLSILGQAFFFSYAGVCETINRGHSKNTARSAQTGSAYSRPSGSTPLWTYKVVNVYPHDERAFTQGLVFQDGVLFEGTGLHGRSSLRKTELETGRVLQIHKLSPQFFGEGITVFGDKVIQLTWRSNVGFVYDKVSLDLLATFKYPTEGWGLTYDGRRLIMSNGTSTLHFLDPETLKGIGQIEVYDTHGFVKGLNELEYVRGEIYANVWPTDRIARIRPDTGQVLGWINLEGLLGPVGNVDVLNGIAYDTKRDRLFITGKMWPKLFEVELAFQGEGQLKK